MKKKRLSIAIQAALLSMAVGSASAAPVTSADDIAALDAASIGALVLTDVEGLGADLVSVLVAKIADVDTATVQPEVADFLNIDPPPADPPIDPPPADPPIDPPPADPPIDPPPADPPIDPPPTDPPIDPPPTDPPIDPPPADPPIDPPPADPPIDPPPADPPIDPPPTDPPIDPPPTDPPIDPPSVDDVIDLVIGSDTEPMVIQLNGDEVTDFSVLSEGNVNQLLETFAGFDLDELQTFGISAELAGFLLDNNPEPPILSPEIGEILEGIAIPPVTSDDDDDVSDDDDDDVSDDDDDDDDVSDDDDDVSDDDDDVSDDDDDVSDDDDDVSDDDDDVSDDDDDVSDDDDDVSDDDDDVSDDDDGIVQNDGEIAICHYGPPVGDDDDSGSDDDSDSAVSFDDDSGSDDDSRFVRKGKKDDDSKSGKKGKKDDDSKSGKKDDDSKSGKKDDDAKSGKKGQKNDVVMDSGITLTVPVDELEMHLGHGDTEGACETNVDLSTVCHKPGTPAEQTKDKLSKGAYDAHLRHGDTQGACGSDIVEDDDSSTEMDDEAGNAVTAANGSVFITITFNNLDADTVAMWPLDVIALLNADHIRQIPPEAFAGFSRKQLEVLSPEAWAGVDEMQIQYIAPAALVVIGVAQLEYMPMDLLFSSNLSALGENDIMLLLASLDINQLAKRGKHRKHYKEKDLAKDLEKLYNMMLGENSSFKIQVKYKHGVFVIKLKKNKKRWHHRKHWGWTPGWLFASMDFSRTEGDDEDLTEADMADMMGEASDDQLAGMGADQINEMPASALEVVTLRPSVVINITLNIGTGGPAMPAAFQMPMGWVVDPMTQEIMLSEQAVYELAPPTIAAFSFARFSRFGGQTIYLLRAPQLSVLSLDVMSEITSKEFDAIDPDEAGALTIDQLKEVDPDVIKNAPEDIQDNLAITYDYPAGASSYAPLADDDDDVADDDDDVADDDDDVVDVDVDGNVDVDVDVDTSGANIVDLSTDDVDQLQDDLEGSGISDLSQSDDGVVTATVGDEGVAVIPEGEPVQTDEEAGTGVDEDGNYTVVDEEGLKNTFAPAPVSLKDFAELVGKARMHKRGRMSMSHGKRRWSARCDAAVLPARPGLALGLNMLNSRLAVINYGGVMQYMRPSIMVSRTQLMLAAMPHTGGVEINITYGLDGIARFMLGEQAMRAVPEFDTGSSEDGGTVADGEEDAAIAPPDIGEDGTMTVEVTTPEGTQTLIIEEDDGSVDEGGIDDGTTVAEGDDDVVADDDDDDVVADDDDDDVVADDDDDDVAADDDDDDVVADDDDDDVVADDDDDVVADDDDDDVVADDDDDDVVADDDDDVPAAS